MKHKVVSIDEWIKARVELLKREKEWTRAKDELSKLRRELPWVKVDKNYLFQTNDGEQSLFELFADRSQLMIYHFMFAPDWKEGCHGCSFMMDNLPARMEHFNQKDVRFVVVSQAPLAKLNEFKKRMEWTFNWVSSFGSEFNFDFNVAFKPDEVKSGQIYYNYENTKTAVLPEREGLSVFCRDGDAIYHTYSTYARGMDILLPTYNLLDLTPKGRDESNGEGWKFHDEY